MSEMANQLQACQSTPEAYQVIAQYTPQILRARAGAVFAYNASRDYLEAVSHWGDEYVPSETFAPQECWALRRGGTYLVDAVNMGVRCKHVDQEQEDYICVPMLAQGDAAGLLHLLSPELEREGAREAYIRLAATRADQVALALVNLKLRETLRGQSIRDSLTGLFNRRYLEESLDREVRRAVRNDRPLAAIMLDLDHFKALNDSHGHEAGDAVLAAVGVLLKHKTRAEDIACRYGGEELAIIMPESTLENAALRAEAICQDIAAMRVSYGATLLQVTASMGVAACPEHGSMPEQIMRAADLALYQAKRRGRNCVVVAESTSALERGTA
jgi:diguanylate cyclase (GGDEF)-like protein